MASIRPFLPGHGHSRIAMATRSYPPWSRPWSHQVHAIRRIATRRQILLCSSLSLSREVCLEPLNPLESAVLPERHAVRTLAFHLGFRLYWGLSWARLLFLTSRPSGVYLQSVSQLSRGASVDHGWPWGCIVLEQLLDQVDVCHYHTSAAVSLATKLVHGVSVVSHPVASAHNCP